MRSALKRGALNSRRCFIGQAGDEFNLTYLPLSGLTRDEIRVGNTVMCGKKGNKAPTDKEIAVCAAYHIAAELNEDIEIVILMGATACSLLKEYSGDFLEAEHGIPRPAELFDWAGWVVPMYHPAAGLHNSTMMIPMLEDWSGLGKWLGSGRYLWPVDRVIRDYTLARTRQHVQAYFAKYGSAQIERSVWLAGFDTEQHGKAEFSVQVSVCPGSAIMILADDHDALDELTDHLSVFEFIFHNAPADLKYAYRIKPDLTYRDTMIEAYHFGNLPQKLKALARRLLGRQRASWEELVGGVSRRKLCEWMWMALQATESWRTMEERISEKTGKTLKPKEVKSDAEKTLSWVLDHTLKSETYDPWEKLEEFGLSDSVREAGHSLDEFEAMPIKGIGNVPLDDAVYYGCSDADDTLTLALMFESMRPELVKNMNIQEADVDRPCATTL